MSESEKTVEAEIVEPSPTEEKTKNKAKASPKHKKKTARLAWLVVSLIAVSFVGFWQAPTSIQQYILSIPDAFTPPSAKFTQKPVATTQPLKMVLSIPEKPSAGSEEIAQLLTAINTLTQELQNMHDSQQALKQAQQDIVTTQLRTRLNWLTSPANHLPQLQLGWEEISFLPSLNAEQRTTAQDMHTLAQLKLNQIRQWQQHIDHLMATLDVPSSMNVMPSSDNPWLNWMAQQFSIQRALSAEEKELQHMRAALLRIRQNMNLERWPNDVSWQQLRARLHVYISKQISAENMPENDQNAALKLPESFTFMDDDIQQLRQTATQWLEAL